MSWQREKKWKRYYEPRNPRVFGFQKFFLSSCFNSALMKQKLLFLFFGLAGALTFAQAPLLHLNFVSHNEPKDSFEWASKFTPNAYWVQQIANLIQSKGAKYNFETCDGFLDGALNLQSAATSTTDIVQTLDAMPNVEIDPRYKSYRVGLAARNYADVAYMIGMCGATPTHVLGGFLWYSTSGNPDWFPYEDSIIGKQYPFFKFRADLMYGPGSFPPHQSDLNDFGLWKPDTTINFYGHNNNRHLWLVGNGCAPVMDSTVNEQEVIDSIQSHVANIQNMVWPSNKFYSATIMINQANFGPTLYNKINTVLDSINITCGSFISWSLITEKYAAFQVWQGGNSGAYSQWLCGQMSAGLEEKVVSADVEIFPNPGSGLFSLNGAEEIKAVEVLGLNGQLLRVFNNNVKRIDLSGFDSGLYFIKLYGPDNTCINKKLIIN